MKVITNTIRTWRYSTSVTVVTFFVQVLFEQIVPFLPFLWIYQTSSHCTLASNNHSIHPNRTGTAFLYVQTIAYILPITSMISPCHWFGTKSENGKGKAKGRISKELWDDSLLVLQQQSDYRNLSSQKWKERNDV